MLYLDRGVMTIRDVAQKYLDQLGDHPTQVMETFERLAPAIQQQLTEIAQAPASNWYDSYFGNVLPNYIEPPELVFDHAESDNEPPYSAKLIMRKQDGSFHPQPLNDTHPARVGFIALRSYLTTRYHQSPNGG